MELKMTGSISQYSKQKEDATLEIRLTGKSPMGREQIAHLIIENPASDWIGKLLLAQPISITINY